VAANGAITELAVYVEAAERDDFCDGAGGARRGGGAIARRSRSLLSDRAVKGA